MIEELKLMKQTRSGTWVVSPATIERENGRILFHRAEFALKDEIKAMAGSKWHGYIDGDNRKIWSVANCTRNNFQLDFMQGGNPYANWDKPLEHWDYSRPLYTHQRLMSDRMLTYHYQLIAAEMGVGKSLSAIEVMEKSGCTDIWYVAPKSGLAAVDREFTKWGLSVQPNLITFDRLRINIERWEDGMPAPQMVFYDESSRLKSAAAKRTKAAQWLADCIRAEWGWEGYVILMSGTPAPKSPVDWWAQCEICYPGFLKEGSVKAFEWRLGIFEQKQTEQGKFWKRKAWRDDDLRCDKCGEFKYLENDDDEVEGRWKLDAHDNLIPNPCHSNDILLMSDDSHELVQSKNEVAYLYDRLDGLVLPLKMEDCLDLPELIYREIVLEPTSTIKRVAKALAGAATTAIQGLTWLRELSDGFQYRDIQDGTEPCPVCSGKGECEQWFLDGEPAPTYDEDGNLLVVLEEEDPTGTYEKRLAVCERCEGTGEIPHMIRETKEIKCPKEAAIRDLLEENEDRGRLVIFAGFRGSIDRIVRVCHARNWDVVRVDGRGWKIMRCDGEVDRTKPLDYWANMDNDRVVFVAHPESGGMGLTLTESRMSVFYSNDFKPESRMQAMARIRRPGMDTNLGATIVDLFHLGTDRKVLDVLLDNRRLETMTLTEMKEML
jgi:hypothetical protein